MDENIEHNHEEYEEPPIKPLWECIYWDDIDEHVKTINVFGCCIFCASTQSANHLDNELGEGNWSIIKLEQMINMNIVNIEFAQYDEEYEEDCEINPGMVDGQEIDGFTGRKCSECTTMNLVPSGMPTFKCSKCGSQNSLENKEK